LTLLFDSLLCKEMPSHDQPLPESFMALDV
jgi:hypothetical protein